MSIKGQIEVNHCIDSLIRFSGGIIRVKINCDKELNYVDTCPADYEAADYEAPSGLDPESKEFKHFLNHGTRFFEIIEFEVYKVE